MCGLSLLDVLVDDRFVDASPARGTVS